MCVCVCVFGLVLDLILVCSLHSGRRKEWFSSDICLVLVSSGFLYFWLTYELLLRFLLLVEIFSKVEKMRSFAKVSRFFCDVSFNIKNVQKVTGDLL